METERITVKGLYVDITSDGIWFTVRNEIEQIIGTIERPHRGQTRWQSYTTDGKATRVNGYIGPRSALIGLTY